LALNIVQTSQLQNESGLEGSNPLRSDTRRDEIAVKLDGGVVIALSRLHSSRTVGSFRAGSTKKAPRRGDAADYG